MATARKTNPRDLVGKKVLGFKFEDGEGGSDIVFAPQMENYIGDEGVITQYWAESGNYQVTFGDGARWSYPASKIKKSLVKGTKSPQKSESIIYYKLKDAKMNYAIQQITGYDFDFYNLADHNGKAYNPVVPAKGSYSGTDCYQILKKNGMLDKFFEPVTEFTFEYRGYKGVISKDRKTVKIGCQTISVEFIEELHRLSSGGYLTLESQTQSTLNRLSDFLSSN